MLEVGVKAPDFELPDQNGKIHRLSDYTGKKVILYFYPKDSTAAVSYTHLDVYKRQHKYISVDIRKRTINIMELDHERCILGSDLRPAQCRWSND